MARVKGGIMANKRRRNILSQTKGYRLDRSNKKRAAREAIFHAHNHAFAHRKDKKNDFRRLWITRINAAVRPHDLTYSRFIKLLTDKNITVNRKMLSDLAKDHPDSFERLVKTMTS